MKLAGWGDSRAVPVAALAAMLSIGCAVPSYRLTVENSSDCAVEASAVLRGSTVSSTLAPGSTQTFESEHTGKVTVLGPDGQVIISLPLRPRNQGSVTYVGIRRSAAGWEILRLDAAPKDASRVQPAEH